MILTKILKQSSMVSTAHITNNSVFLDHQDPSLNIDGLFVALIA